MPRHARPNVERAAAPAAAEARSNADENHVLDLQRRVGNAAVSRLVQRDPASPVSLSMRPPPDLSAGAVAQAALVDHGKAVDAVRAWLAHSYSGGDGPRLDVLSVPEVVNLAGKLDFTTKTGQKAKVSSQMQPGGIEMVLRSWAKDRGTALRENRAAGDVEGTQSQVSAVLENLGKLPSSVKLGGDKANLTLHLAGKVTAEAKAGDVKVEGEGSPGGGSVSVTDKRGGGVELRGGPEGGGGSLKIPGGPKVGVDVTGKGAKLDIKAGDFVLKGSLEREAGGGVAWSAEISLGTIGKLVSGGEIAKVAQGATESLTNAAGALRDGLTPEFVKAQGEPVKKAVEEAAAVAKKIAETKPGWRVGLEAKGSPTTGVFVGVTLTWVF